MQCLVARRHHSAGTSNESGSLNPRFPHSEGMPAAIQIERAIIAGRLKFSHNPRQMRKPAKGRYKIPPVSFLPSHEVANECGCVHAMNAMSAPKIEHSAPSP